MATGSRSSGGSVNRGGRLLLVGVGLAVLALAARTDPAQRWFGAEEAAAWQAAASIAHDGDLLAGADDARRFREVWGWSEPAGASAHFDVPAVQALVLAPAVAVAPRRGPIVLQAALFLLAAILAAGRLRSRWPGDARLWLLFGLAASTAWLSVLRLTPVPLALIFGLVAYAWIEPRPAHRREQETPDEEQLYGGPGPRVRGSLGASLGAGLLLAAAASLHAAWLGMAIPYLWGRNGETGWRSRLLRGGALLGPLALTLAWGAREGAGPLVDASWSLPAALAEGSWRAVLEPHGLAWSLVFLAVGGQLGSLVYAAPLWAAAGDRERRGAAAVGIVIGLVILLMTAPSALLGGSGPLPPGLILPLLLPLLFTAVRWPPRPLVAVALVVGLAGVAPLAARAVQAAFGSDRPDAWVSPLARWLPLESNQDRLAGAGPFLEVGGVHLRAVRGAGTDVGQRGFLLFGAEPGEIWVSHARPLSAVVVSFGPEAPADLAVEGGEVVSSLFRPDGGIDFRVEGLEPRRRHPMPWSQGRPELQYRLRLSLPEATAAALPFDVAVEWQEDEQP